MKKLIIPFLFSFFLILSGGFVSAQSNGGYNGHGVRKNITVKISRAFQYGNSSNWMLVMTYPDTGDHYWGNVQGYNASTIKKLIGRSATITPLQNAVNSQSQTNNRMSNMQKARHDAMMATVQAIR